MKKIVLSAVAALTLGSVAANASATKLYQDENGQVFTQAGAGRTAIKSDTSVTSHAGRLDFSGQAFIGYKSTSFDDYGNTPTAPQILSHASAQDFEVRRGYLQTKAYFFDDPKSYYRVTLDLKRSGAVDGGSMVARAKYAYLNLNIDSLVPATSLEIGLAHRPWHDYEEHNGWLYRNASEILIENHNSADLSSSADMGVMAKTRTKFLDADIGVFNGEGYHSGNNNNKGLSLEWRFTGHLLGTHGHPTKNTYFDASFFGQLNNKHSTPTFTQSGDLDFYGFHTVFNMPAFLAAAEYVTSDDTKNSGLTPSSKAGDGYSLNVEGRIGAKHQYKAFAKYDNWTPKSSTIEYTRKTEIFGVAWRQNSSVEWVANATINDDDNNAYALKGGKFNASTANGTSYMLTAQIDF